MPVQRVLEYANVIFLPPKYNNSVLGWTGGAFVILLRMIGDRVRGQKDWTL